MRLYTDLGSWFHLLTSPDEYTVEAERYREVILGAAPSARTLLELGSGGGNNALHLREHFACTLSDISPQMLGLSREINPWCEHVLGDMRTLRLGRTFDVAFIHDAVMYMTTEDDLRSCLATAYAHTRPGGVALVVPDFTRETFAPCTEHGGHDGADGRSLRYLAWTREPADGGTTFVTDYALLLSEPGKSTRAVFDHHVEGLFPEHTWLHLLEKVGFTAVEVIAGDPDDEDRSQPLFLARRG